MSEIMEQQGNHDNLLRKSIKLMIKVLGATFKSLQCDFVTAGQGSNSGLEEVHTKELFLEASYTAKRCSPAVSQQTSTWWRLLAAQYWGKFSASNPSVEVLRLPVPNGLDAPNSETAEYTAELHHLGMRSILTCSVTKKDSLIGLLMMLFDSDPMLSEDQLEVMSQVASQLSEVLSLPPHKPTVQNHVADLTADLPPDSDLDSNLAAAVSQEVPADYAFVGVLTQGEAGPLLSGVRCTSSQPPELQRITGGLAPDWLAVCLSKGDAADLTPYTITRNGEDVKIHGEAHGWFKPEEIQSVVVVTSERFRAQKAVFMTMSRKTREWSSSDLNCLSTLASMMGTAVIEAGAIREQKQHIEQLRAETAQLRSAKVEMALAHARFVEQENGAQEELRHRNDALQHQLRQAALVQDIVMALRDSLQPTTALEKTAQLLASYVAASHCFVRQLRPGSGSGSESEPEPAEGRPSSLRTVWSTAPNETTLQAINSLHHPLSADQSQEVFTVFSSSGPVLVAPTLYHGQPNGLIGLNHSGERHWTMEERYLLKAVADHVGFAIEYVSHVDSELQRRVAEQRNEELSATLKRAEVLRTVVTEIRDSLDTMSILQTTTRILAQEFGASVSIIRSVSESSEDPTPVVLQLCQHITPGALSLSEDQFSPTFVKHLHSRILSVKETTAFASRGALVEFLELNDSVLGEACEIVERHNIHSIWEVPTFYRGKMNGLICLIFTTERQFRPGEKDFLNAIKDHLGIALEHARLLQNEQKQKAELVSKNDALQRATAEAQAASQAKSEFLSVISHELRTPMTAVLGIAQLLLQTPLDCQQREFCETIISSGNALVDMIGELLDCNKIEHGSLKLEYAYFHFEEFLEGVIDLMSPIASTKNLAFTYSIDPGVPALVYSDPRRIRQILINLIGNALKFTEVGTVTVEAWATSKALPVSRSADRDSDCDPDRPPTPATLIQIDIADTGPGIDPKDRCRLFQYFQQLDSSKTRRFNGTGIGLYLSKNLVLLLGGDLWVDSSPSIGSTFHFTVPLVTPTSPTQPLLALSPPPPPPALHLPKPCRIVLAVRNRVAAAMIAFTSLSLGAQVLRLLPDDPIPGVLPQLTDLYVYDDCSENIANRVPEAALLCKVIYVLFRSKLPLLQAPATLEESNQPLPTPPVQHLQCGLVHQETPSSPPSLFEPLLPQETPSSTPSLLQPEARPEDFQSGLVSTSTPATPNFSSPHRPECRCPPSSFPRSSRRPHKVLYQPLHRATFTRAVVELLQSPQEQTHQGPIERQGSVERRPQIVTGRRLDILLAEDNALSAKIVAMMLRRLGHNVDIVSNGRAAVEAVGRKHFDLVLMDWMMPDMDGLTACRSILQLRPESSSRPLLSMLTANASTTDRETCLAAGVDHYITKPVRMEDLQKITALCASRDGAS